MMHRAGLLAGIFKRYTYKLRLRNEPATLSPITLQEVVPILSIVGIGALISIALVTMEICVNKSKRKRQSTFRRGRSRAMDKSVYGDKRNGLIMYS